MYINYNWFQPMLEPNELDRALYWSDGLVSILSMLYQTGHTILEVTDERVTKEDVMEMLE